MLEWLFRLLNAATVHVQNYSKLELTVIQWTQGPVDSEKTTKNYFFIQWVINLQNHCHKATNLDGFKRELENKGEYRWINSN